MAKAPVLAGGRQLPGESPCGSRCVQEISDSNSYMEELHARRVCNFPNQPSNSLDYFC